MLLYFLSEVPSNPVTVCQKLSVANPDQMSPAYFKQFFFSVKEQLLLACNLLALIVIRYVLNQNLLSEKCI